MWRDNKEKIRRFLRDPDSNIWTDSFLLRAFNDSSSDFCEAVGLLQRVEAVRVPPTYQMSYTHEWEWGYLDHDGHVYKALKYHHQGDGCVCCNKWETQALGLSTGSETDEGSAFVHPWEAYMGVDVNAATPIWFPEDFNHAGFVAWDKKQIEYKSKKEIMENHSWKSQTGEPQYYYREDLTSNEFYLYPKPTAPVWDEVDGDTVIGQVIFSDDQDATAEIGTILDMAGITSTQDEGIVTDVVDHDDNVLLIYDGYPADLESQDDESDYPRFLQKYIEYGTLEQAYSANTDGRISSLKDYWKWRKDLGIEFIKQFKWSRMQDRDFELTSKDGGSRRNRKGPRLPDEYPAI